MHSVVPVGAARAVTMLHPLGPAFVSEAAAAALFVGCIALSILAFALGRRLRAQQLAAELDQRARPLRQFMDSVTDHAIYTLDRNGLVIHWDKGAEQLMRYQPQDIQGRHFSLLFTEEDRRLGTPDTALATAATEGRCKTDHWVVRKDRTGFWGSGVIQPIIDPDGRLLGHGLIVRDVTDRWLEQQALQQAKDQAEAAAYQAERLSAAVQAANDDLKAANDKLLRFTSIVAHDLRAPLQRVEAFTQMLDDDYGSALDADGHDIMARIGKGVQRIRLMLAALLDYSKRSGGSVQGKTASLARVIEAALEDLSVGPEAVDVTVNIEGAPEVVGDPLLLGHVLQNLISNSVKFRHPDRKCQIVIEATRLASGEIMVSVADNGIGVEPQFANRVFEMFYRLHDEDEYEGVGIGLSVCQKIIGDHGGRIWFDRAKADGARVMFTLQPAETMELKARAQQAA